jgi:toxin FitB
MNQGLLDTSVLIAFADQEFDSALPLEAAISIATIAELHFGVLVAKDEVTQKLRLRRLASIEATFEPILIDHSVARAFGFVAHRVQAAGRQPRSRIMDLWIAATALAHNLPLYTRNTADFSGLDELIEVHRL